MEDWRDKELELQKILTDKLFFWLKGNKQAVRFCIDITYIAHLWDDLIDKDKERTDDEINAAFRIALVDIPCNPFYLDNIGELRPLMMNAIMQWQDANQLEIHGNRHDAHMAYMLRASFLQIFNYCAYLCGGPDWIREIGLDMRRLYEEELAEFMEEIEKCQI